MSDNRVVLINRRISSIGNTTAVQGIHKGEWFITQDTNTVYWKNPVTNLAEQIAGRSDGALVTREVTSINDAMVTTTIKSGELFVALDEGILYWKNPNNGDTIEAIGGKNKVLSKKILGSGRQDLNLLQSRYFYTTITANTTFQPINYDMSDEVLTDFILEIKNGGQFTITWWENIQWEFDAPPILSTYGTTLFGFYGSRKAGEVEYKWKGVVLSQEFDADTPPVVA